MRRISIFNTSINKKVFENALMTESFSERLMGLMFKKTPLEFDAMVIDRCDSIHTFFMRFAIDAVFLNRESKVIKVIKDVKPFKIILPISDAYYVIECESKEYTEQNFKTGDTIEFLQK